MLLWVTADGKQRFAGCALARRDDARLVAIGKLDALWYGGWHRLSLSFRTIAGVCAEDTKQTLGTSSALVPSSTRNNDPLTAGVQ
jgi:hypothetical protein